MSPARVVVQPLGDGPSPEQLLRRADGLPGLVCLRGRFAGGAAVLTSHPIRVLPAGALPWGEPGLVPVGSPQRSGDPTRDVDAPTPTPVAGGWFGVAGYDRAATRFAFHDHVVRLVDGGWRFEALWTPERDAALAERRAAWAALIAGPAAAAADADADVAADIGVALDEVVLPPHLDHLRAVERAVELIRAGELYQVNVCTRLTARLRGTPAALFAAAAERLDPGYGAFLADPDPQGRRAVVSLSPELFWRRRGGTVLSAPIKGTRPVGQGNADALRASAKDVAENVMIVDLVRNDLGRVCEPGSVTPTALLQVVEHVGVLHLVSEVTGRLRPDVDDGDVHTALFPPGSVTGTPKERALEVVAAVEAQPRGAYTGAIGFVSPVWGAEFTVAIRTFEIDGDVVELGVGGGVTVDSVPEAEWRECLDKAAPLLTSAGATPSVSAGAPASPRRPTTSGPPGAAAPRPDAGVFETLLAIDGVPLRTADHLARLDRSARELFGLGVPPDVARRVQEAAATAGLGRAAVRVTVTPDDGVAVTAAPARPIPAPTAAVVATRAPVCWRHKWADRAWAVVAERAAGEDVPLFVAADGTVLETTRGNVLLIAPDGHLVTAPLRDDLLPGVTRRALLDHARDTGRGSELRGFGLDELRSSPAFWTSSLSIAVPITAVDGHELPRDDATVAGFVAALTGADDLRSASLPLGTARFVS